MRRAVLAFVILLLAACAQAPPGSQSGSCPGQFAGGRPPALLNQRLAAGTRLLCNQDFAVLYSAVTRTPLWSAEHLTAAQVEAARDVPRQGEFHPDERLPPGEGAVLRDYARSGYDRGHMSPSGDMPTPDSQQESFSLANMVPQAPELNRNLWERIERATRGLAAQDGQIYVVTGPVFQGAQLQALHGRVLVPTAVYKAIYDPARGQGAAYLCANSDRATWQVVSLAQLAGLSGINPFPGATVASAPLPLPIPELHPRSNRYSGRPLGAGRARNYRW